MIKLKLTATKIYDANSDNYPGAKSAEDMAKLDEENVFDIINYSLEDGTLNIKIEVI